MDVKEELKKLANGEKAKILQRFFKTGEGEYGEGDKFLGIIVPKLRKLAKKYREIGLAKTINLLHSKIHEERLLALLILVDKFKKNSAVVYNLYLKNIKYINSWDLVDLSADKIMGEYLREKSKDMLYKLSKSKNFWERRIAIMATFNFIKKNKFSETLKVAKILLKDKEDLIHKAVGWMLREVGKRNLKTEEDFLEKYCQNMPRTMLRYAIERFSKKKRKDIMRQWPN